MYRLSRFCNVSLLYANQVDDIGSGKVATNWQILPGGGALNNLGNQQKYPNVVQLTKSFRLTAVDVPNMQDTYNELRVLVGQTGRLYREFVDGTLHWIYAELIDLDAEREFDLAEHGRVLDIKLVFETMEAAWHGAKSGLWYFDSGEYFDTGLLFDEADDETTALTSSPTVFAIGVGSATDYGRTPVRAVEITVEAGDAAMSAITIARTDGETLTFGGSVAAGDRLYINSGTMQVTNGGVSAYDDLTFTADADMAAWFSLLAGDNEITVTWTGGGTGAQITIDFYESWR